MEKMLICEDCNMMFVGIKEDKCAKCCKVESLEMVQHILDQKLGEMIDNAKKFTSDFMDKPGEQGNYLFHLGQVSALTDVRNLLMLMKIGGK